MKTKIYHLLNISSFLKREIIDGLSFPIVLLYICFSLFLIGHVINKCQKKRITSEVCTVDLANSSNQNTTHKQLPEKLAKVIVYVLFKFGGVDYKSFNKHLSLLKSLSTTETEK